MPDKPSIFVKHLLKPFLFLMAMGVLCQISNAQGTNIKFKHLSLREGLSQSTINCAYQDKKGFMWFGTQDGLNKFNGYEFEVYKNIPGDSTTLSNGFINDFVEVGDNLWIATNQGLNVLNSGTKKISSYTTKNSSIPSDEVHKLIVDNDSNLWVAFPDVISYFNLKTKKFKSYKYEEGGNNVPFVIKDFVVGPNNLIWIATENRGLLYFDKKTGEIKPFILEGIDLNGSVNCIYIDKDGDLLVGTQQQGMIVINSKGSKVELFKSSNQYLSISENNVTDIYQDHEGKIWVGTEGGGLNRFNKSKKKQFTSFKRRINDESSISSNNVKCLVEDRTGVLWVGTELGISYFDLLKQNFNHYQTGVSSINSISGNIVWSIFVDENGLVWIGTNEGLNTLDRETNEFKSYLPTISVNSVKRNTSIYAIYKDKSGRIWLGTDGGLYQFNPANNSFNRHVQANNTSRTYKVYEDSRSRIWACTKDGLVLLAPNGNLIARYKRGSNGKGLPDNVTRDIIEDKDGDFWIGTDGGLCKITFKNNRATFKSFQKENTGVSALNNKTILSLQEDDKGFIWIGTFGGGLNRFDKKSESFIQYTQRDGLPNNVIYGILKDNKNNLWLSTNRGIANFSIESKSFIATFDESDGLQSNEFNVGAYYKHKNGELFFGGIKGFNSFFPANIRKNQIKPQLVLTDFELFNKSVPIGPDSKLKKHISELDEVVLSYTDNVFTFSYAALHYSMPERNRYAYKMEGFDENWIYDNSRKAKYTNLDPDEYVFKVKATNSDGVWGDEISIKVIINPPFWQIKWVWALAIFLLGSGAFTFYQSRLKRIKAQKEFLEVQVKERTKELIGKNEEVEKQKALLEEEKDKLETLLLNILPQSTVEELKKKGKATARNYRKASVMFTDFKDFTKISEKLSPTELVERLDSFFVQFDGIIEKYNVEKIKTIGDAYMCAGGIPIRNKSNPVDVVLASLEIQRSMEKFRKNLSAGDVPWGLRLGVHTGNLVAGVIGIKRFAYDIWGDTVNVASRVESGGEVGRVNVSGQTYEEIKEFFVCEYRGKIHAKNKGEIDMFFVNSIKPELSENGEGIEPNKAFWNYVNQHYISEIKYRELEKFMVNKLSDELAEDLYYHGIHHTIDVCEAAERIAHKEGVSGDDIFILKAAALFHDAGYTKKYRDNEYIGVEMAREILPDYGFTEEQVENVAKLVLSTFVERQPTTKLEMIIRDADLDYLGRDDFNQISEALKNELVDREIITGEVEWDKIQVDFLTKHQYYTETSKSKRMPKKLENLEMVKKRLAGSVKS